jgi:2-methylcitrate dehydratase PrpD
MPFCLAIALIHHRLDHDDFTDRAVTDPVVQNLMSRTRHTPGAPSLVVTLKDGSRLMEPAKHPGDITEWSQFTVKFRACVDGLLSDHQADTVIDLVGRLEDLHRIGQLTAALRTKIC